MSYFRTKSVDAIRASAEEGEHKLARRLTAFDLMMLGVGAIIGAGIFVLTGTAAATKAGPAIVLSFVLSGLGCAFAGFCYAELASMIPVAGSAYTYAYATLGELFAWIIGWDLILEYAVGAITVAIGWSGYFCKLLEGWGIQLPGPWIHGALNCFDPAHPTTSVHCGTAGAVHGILNVPAVVLVAGITLLLVVGVKESARVTSIVVLVKVAIVLLFLGLGFKWVQPANWHPFMPFGLKGILAGAGVIFFAYIGFDAITTTSEETVNPKRDLPIGILGSLGICTLLYIAVALVLTGMVPYVELNDPAPVALALGKVGIHWGVLLVSIGAVFGLASVVLVLLMGQPRVFFAMSRDGLLSPWISTIHPRFQTPHRSTIITGIVVAVFAGILPIDIAGELTSIGTLFAFVLVCCGVIVLRITRPDLPRSFRTPGSPIVPALGAICCLAMMIGLPWETWVRFVAWLGIGLLIYFFYSYRHSLLGKQRS